MVAINTVIKPRTVIGTETIGAKSPAVRPDFGDSAGVDLGLEIKIQGELSIVHSPKMLWLLSYGLFHSLIELLQIQLTFHHTFNSIRQVHSMPTSVSS